MKTDDLPYFQWMEKIWARERATNASLGRRAGLARTDFEQHFLAKGLPIYRARLRKL